VILLYLQIMSRNYIRYKPTSKMPYNRKKKKPPAVELDSTGKSIAAKGYSEWTLRTSYDNCVCCQQGTSNVILNIACVCVCKMYCLLLALFLCRFFQFSSSAKALRSTTRCCRQNNFYIQINNRLEQFFQRINRYTRS